MKFDLRKLLIVSLINLVGLPIYAQSRFEITNSEKLIGKNYLTNKNIIAKEIVFPKYIYRCYLDTLSKCITVQLRRQTESGKVLSYIRTLMVYDLEHKKEKWSEKINSPLAVIEQHGDLIIQTIGKKSYSLNFENGETQWEVKNTIYYADPIYKIGIGYRITDFNDKKNELEGINLINGETVWKTNISRVFGWNNLFHLNDSTIIIVASGLHSVNIKNGLGWDYNTMTGEMHYSGRTGIGLSETLMGPTLPANKLVEGVVSNVVVDSANLYFASKEKIARLDHRGELIWSSPLPVDLTSKSYIFIKDRIIYMINYGCAFMGYHTLHYGKPFIAAFDSNTGRQIYFNTTNGNRDKINGFQIRRDKVFLVLKNRIAEYSLTDGSFIREKNFKIGLDEDMVDYIGNQVYIKTNSSYTNLALSDSTTHCIFRYNNKVLVLNDRFEIIKQMDSSELYICYLKVGDYRFLVNSDKTTIINNKNQVVAVIDVGIKTKLIGTKFYSLNGKSFIETDLSDLIKNNLPE
jgi:outer membrane protein assembly factor BamB